MAGKHLITWGIGYNASGDYPFFLVTHGLSIREAAAATVAPVGERLTETFVLLRRQTGEMAVLRRQTATSSLLRRITKDLTR